MTTMTTIQAWQHIYSNVEKEQSPQQRGGFQTLFYTQSGLSEDDISEMEGRLLYFPAQNAEPVKRLFFRTTSGKGVVAQITPLPEPDQYGRQGRYLAHALAFEPETLATFEADPFRLFRHFTFFKTVDEALAQGDFKTGNIPPVSVALPATATGDVEAAQSWPTTELTKLALLALRVERQAEARQAITVAGQPEQIEAALEAAFLAVPVSMRPRCTFDTYFYRCNLVATFYWAIGLLESPVSIKFVLIDAAGRTVQGDAPLQPETAYERWVVAHLEQQKLAQIAQDRDRAFALGEWLDKRDYDLSQLEATTPALITALFGVNTAAVRAFLRQRLGEILPPPLVDRATEYIYSHTEAPDLYRQLREGFVLAPLLDVLYESYQAQKFSEPARDEVNALNRLLDESPHGLLRLFVAYWRSVRRQLPEALDQASEADYEQFVKIALDLGLVKPTDLVRSGRGELFLNLYLAGNIQDWADLTEALLEEEEAACLARLSDRAAQFSRSELYRIDKLIDGREDVPTSFGEAVAQAIAALPPEGGFKGLIRAAWQRLPGVGGD